MPQMTDFVYKFYNEKLIEYQEMKGVWFLVFIEVNILMIFFQQEELSRYDCERDLPYDPLQPSIRAFE